MEYQIKIEDKEAYLWLRGLLENTLGSSREKAFTAYPHMEAWIKAFDEAESRQSGSKDFKPTNQPLKEKSKKTKTKAKPNKNTLAAKETKKDPQGKLDKSGQNCSLHKTYQGMRRPRTDCKACWDIYKKFHPMEYDSKRRSFLAARRHAN